MRIQEFYNRVRLLYIVRLVFLRYCLYSILNKIIYDRLMYDERTQLKDSKRILILSRLHPNGVLFIY